MSRKELHAELIKKVKDMGFPLPRGCAWHEREEYFQERKKNHTRRVCINNEPVILSTGWAQYDMKKNCWPDWYCYRLRNIKKDKGGSLEGQHNQHLYKEDLYYWAKHLNKLKVRKNMKYRELATILYQNT